MLAGFEKHKTKFDAVWHLVITFWIKLNFLLPIGQQGVPQVIVQGQPQPIGKSIF